MDKVKEYLATLTWQEQIQNAKYLIRQNEDKSGRISYEYVYELLDNLTPNNGVLPPCGSTIARDKFNHDKFWQWVRDCEHCVIVSENKL